MRSYRNGKVLVCLLGCVLVFGLSGPVLADGTPSGTPVNNSATVSYSVGGLGQTPIPSNVVTFVVDNKIDLTVTTVDLAIVSVIPGATSQVLTYTVQNDGNTVQDYSLQAQDSPVGAFGEVETIDANLVGAFVDANGNGSYEPLVDVATYIDELAIDANINVFVVANIPLAAVDNDVASYDLIAQTAQGGAPGAQGADILNDDSGVADDPNTVQTVFADGAGTADAAQDGRHSSLDGYKIVTADLNVAKSQLVTNDPFNGGANPKAIPGATVDYTIDISNTGSATATSVAVVDAVPANTAFLVGSVVNNPAAGTTVEYSSDNGATWVHVPVAGPDGTDPAVTDLRVTFATIANGGTAQSVFQVLIQ